MEVPASGPPVDDDETASVESDPQDRRITGACRAALRSQYSVPAEQLTVLVLHGWVALGGTVGEPEQKSAAEAAVRRQSGVMGVFNNILVRPPGRPQQAT